MESVEEKVDWHAILVADFEYSDLSDEDISSGEELESEEDEEEFSSSRLPLGKRFSCYIFVTSYFLVIL